MSRRRSLLALALIVALAPASSADPGQTHIVYTAQVKKDGPRHFHFTVEVRNPNQDVITFIVPHWAPGAYRELTVGARGRGAAWLQLDGFAAVNGEGKELKVEADGPRRWKVACKGEDVVRFSYVNTNPGRPNNNRSYLGEGSGLIDGPRSWVYVEGKKDLPVHVHFDLPEGWEVGTGLDPTFDPRIYSAKDYDRLIDCPTLVGAMKSWTWTYRGVPHRVVVDGAPRAPRFDEAAFLDMVKKVVKVYVDMFDDVPYEHYTFIYTPGGGGLEHLTSTTIGGVRRMSARSLMGVTAHEFFHTWNVKRLRPKKLGPFDYTSPQPVNDLWICEGLTSYYTPHGLWRAGLYTTQQYLDRQAGGIGSWERNFAHLVQSPEASSRGVWTNDTRISYYLQGQVLGMMIDLAIRDGSDNRFSLDDVMRVMYRKHGGYYRHLPPKPGFESEDWPRTIKELTGVDLEWFWKAHIRDSQPVDWNRYLKAAAWELEITRTKSTALAAAQTRRGEGGRVELIVSDGDALHRAGFRDGDELQQFNGSQVRGRFGLRRALRGVEAGAAYTAQVGRGEKVIEIKGKLEPANEFGMLGYDDGEGGALLREVPRGTALWKGGLRDGDLVVKYDGKPVEKGPGMQRYLNGRALGDTVEFQIRRGGKSVTCRVKVQAAETIRVGKMKILPNASGKQMRIREGMRTGKTDR